MSSLYRKIRKAPLFPLVPIVPLLAIGGLLALEAFILRRVSRLNRMLEPKGAEPLPG